MASWWTPYILRRSRALGLDPRAVHSVASVEGLSGAVGDAGTSFGPFQLHVGGALPSGRGRSWAESRAGIDYALNQIAGVAKGLQGQAAINAIVRRFERPADPTGEVARAWAAYGSAPAAGPAAPSLGSTVANAAMPSKTRREPGYKVAPLSVEMSDPRAMAQGIFSSLASGGLPDIASLSSARQTFTLPGLSMPGKRVPVGGKMLARNSVHVEGIPAPETKAGAGIVGLAAKQLGQPYVWGGESRKEGGFDCSGLIDWAMRQQGYKGPRLTTYSIANMGVSVRNKPLRPGDMVLSNGGEHVSIYAGNGKVIVAPHTGAVVRWQPLSDFRITDIRRV